MAGTESRSEARPAARWARTAATTIGAGGRRLLDGLRGAVAGAREGGELRLRLDVERARAARIESRAAQVEAITHLGSWEADLGAGTVTWSAEAYRIVGRDPDEFTPTLTGVLELVVPEDRAAVRERFQATAAGQVLGPWRCRMVRSDGEVRVIEALAALTGEGRVSGFYQDVTEPQRVADQLERERELLARAEQIARLGAWQIDIATGEFMVSRGWHGIVGVPVGQQMVLDDLLNRVHPEHQAAAQEWFNTLVRGERPERLLYRFIRPDGDICWIEAQAELTAGGQLQGFAQDVTERREFEQRRETDRKRLELAMEMARLAAWEVDTAAGTSTWSDAVVRIASRSPAVDGRSLDVASLFSPEEQDRFVRLCQAILDGERPPPAELRITLPDGEVRWLRAEARLVGPGHVVGFCQDVTERRAEEDKLRLHGHILEAMTEEIVVMTFAADARFLYFNGPFARGRGYTEAELAELTPADLNNADGERLGEEIGRALLTHGRWEGDMESFRKDGSTRLAHVAVMPLHLENEGDVVVAIGSDVTEQRHQQSALRESEERLRIIQESSPIGMGLIDLGHRWVQINEAGAAMFGYEPRELVGRPVDELLPPGDTLPVEGRADALQSEQRLLRRDGREVWVLASTSLMRDAAGHSQFFVTHMVDVTDRKAGDERLRRQATEIERANRAKTEFLSRMSHELRTPLNAVLGYGQLLALAGLEGHQGEAVDQILRAGRHLLDLVDEVLDITGVEAGTLVLTPEPLSVDGVIGDAVRLVQPMADAADIRITVAETGPEGTVYGDRRGTTQILLNLLSNAIKFNHPLGRVSVTTRRSGNEVKVAVTDTGRGIAPEAIPRVFEPFDRIGAEQLGIQGTGIGLPLAKSLAEHMNGTLTVESERGGGSTFTLTLPTGASNALADTDAVRGSVEEAPEPAPPIAGHDLTVVNIEDNPANQMLVAAILRERPDIRLHTAATGAEGIDLIDEHHPDLVLLDLHLPDMHGTEVLRHLTELGGPAPAVAVLSADANPEQVSTVLALGAKHYLVKPLDVSALLQLVDSTVPAVDPPRP